MLPSTAVPKKTSTSLLCELTRLKSQQKYLECSQMKINPEHYDDGDEDKDTVYEIENLKANLENQLNEFREAARRDVQDVWIFINAIKDDVFNQENFQKCTVNGIRDRIIGINLHLSKLIDRNRGCLEGLQKSYEELNSGYKIKFL